MLVLGIETSCDETAAAVVGPSGILSDVVYTQEVHAAYGGVVPELAARAHQERLAPTVRAALERAAIERPDAVVATAGPGLVGALLVGWSFGRALAAGWGVPFRSVHHLEGHLLSPLLEPDPPTPPFLALVVSGGHTALYRCDGVGRYATLGQTLDDAAGEVYDKVARVLGLGWPGGPFVDRAAAAGDPTAVAFPRPLPGELDFSFSGLKTAVLQHVQRPGRASDEDVCASFQAAVVECLVTRVRQAARATGIEQIAVAGGVAANSGLRIALSESGLGVHLPPRSRCTDNGAMIANVGRLHLLAGDPEPPAGVRSGWPL